MMKFCVVTIALLLMLDIVSAQKIQSFIGSGPALTAYKGDLSGYEKLSAGIEINVFRNKDSSRVLPVYSFSGGKIVAQGNVTNDLNYADLNYVQTSFLCLNFSLNYYFIKRDNLKAYIGAGIGIFQFKPMDEYGEEVYSVTNNTRVTTENYALTKPILPVQAGLLYKVRDKFALYYTIRFLNTRTDYLDNISLLANPNDKDNILTSSIGFLIPLTRPE